MATQDNLSRRIERLIETGRVYYGQKSERMQAVLEDAASRWMCSKPKRDTYGSVVDGAEPVRRRWGEGPNEDLGSMMAEARAQLYGCATVGIEDIERFNAELPGVFSLATKALKEANQRRAAGSPYAPSLIGLCEYLIAVAYYDGTIPELTGDPRNWDDFQEFGRWPGIKPARLRLQFSRLHVWFGRWCHHHQRSAWIDEGDGLATVEKLMQLPSHNQRIAMACALVYTNGNLAEAIEISGSVRNLTQVEDQMKLLEVLA